MPAAKVTDDDFIAAWYRHAGYTTEIAADLGITLRQLYNRRRAIERRTGKRLEAGGFNRVDVQPGGGPMPPGFAYRPEIAIAGFTGTAVVFGDCHYWPGLVTVAHRALIEVCRQLKPDLIIANGDIFDGARVSRHPRNGWEYRPTMVDELEEVKTRLAEVRMASPRSRLLRTIGNHDQRFDSYLSRSASEAEGLLGTRLSDHLPAWEEATLVRINGGTNDHTVIKHRFRGGIHAAYNNTLHGGVNMITSHTHYNRVLPWGDYRGRRYGAEVGCIADIAGPQTVYAEGNPTAQCSGFGVLRFTDAGMMLHPELVEVRDGAAWFRGEVVATTEVPMHKPVSPARRDAPARIKPARRKRPATRKMILPPKAVRK